MNTHNTDKDISGDMAVEADIAAEREAAVARKLRDATKRKPASTSKAAQNSKKEQLLALLSKPKGAPISVICARLGWQAHTVRAALSRLRKQGIEVATLKSPKTGETIYVIVAPARGEGGDVGDRDVS